MKRRGLILTLENQFNRFVPPWLVRFSVGDILDLNLATMSDSLGRDADPNFQFQSLDDAAERDELRRFTWNTVPEETTRNDLGYAARREGTQALTGGVWVGVESFLQPELGFEIRLAGDQAWLYCAYVDSSARGGGVYKRLLAFLADDLTQRGFNTLFVVIQPWNRPSMKVHGRYADRTIGRIIAFRFLTWSYIRVTGSIQRSATMTNRPATEPVHLRLS